MKLWKMVACGLIWAGPAIGQEAGECLTIKDADERYAALGEEAVASGPLFIGGVQVGWKFLIKRADGTFKETHMVSEMVCHIKDFVGDPRKKSSGA